MKWEARWSLALMALMVVNAGLRGQGTPPALPQPKNELPSPPAADIVAATVNGQPIAEIAVYRAALAEERKNYDLLRKDILEHLIENSLIDQYLIHLKIAIDSKEIEEKIGVVKAQAEKKGGLDKLLKANFVTEAELRTELASMLRWEKFVVQQSTEPVLKDFFAKNLAMFDGSQVHVRHILLKTDQGLTKEQAMGRLVQLKKWMEEETQREMNKLPKLPPELVEKRTAETLDKIFADVATKESTCPSKENGGNLPWFQRAGMMVEPFSRTAFALKPFQMSDVVATQFGYHLILTIDRKPGREVKYDDVKFIVREVYSDRLREAVITAMKPNARIVINPLGK